MVFDYMCGTFFVKWAIVKDNDATNPGAIYTITIMMGKMTHIRRRTPARIPSATDK